MSYYNTNVFLTTPEDEINRQIQTIDNKIQDITTVGGITTISSDLIVEGDSTIDGSFLVRTEDGLTEKFKVNTDINDKTTISTATTDIKSATTNINSSNILNIQTPALDIVDSGFPTYELGLDNPNNLHYKKWGSTPILNMSRINGTVSSQSALSSNNAIFQVRAGGYDGSNLQQKVAINAQATQNWSNGNHGYSLSLATVKNGSVLPTENLKIDDDGVINVLQQIRLGNKTTTDINNLTNTANGQIIYDTTIEKPKIFTTNQWNDLITKESSTTQSINSTLNTSDVKTRGNFIVKDSIDVNEKFKVDTTGTDTTTINSATTNINGSSLNINTPTTNILSNNLTTIISPAIDLVDSTAPIHEIAFDVAGGLRYNKWGDRPILNMNRYNGTSSAPSAVNTNNALFQIRGGGFDGTVIQNKNVLTVGATENWSSAGHGYSINLATLQNGSNGSPTVRLLIENDGVITIYKQLKLFPINTSTVNALTNTSAGQLVYDLDTAQVKLYTTQWTPLIKGNSSTTQTINSSLQLIGSSFQHRDSSTAYNFSADINSSGISYTRYALEPTISLQRYNGTPSVPSNVLNGERLGVVSFNGLSSSLVSSSVIRSVATQDWTGTNKGSKLEFQTVQNSTVGAPSTRMTINDTGVVDFTSTVNVGGNLTVSGTISSFYGQIYCPSVAPVSPVATFSPVQNVYTKCDFTTTTALLNGFDSPVSSRLRYIGTQTRMLRIEVSIAIGGTIAYDLKIYKNGVADDSSFTSLFSRGEATVTTLISANQNDYFELYALTTASVASANIFHFKMIATNVN